MFIEIKTALENAGIFAKLMKCAAEFGRCNSCGQVYLMPLKCGSRLCPFEARRRSRDRVGLYERLMRKAKNPRFLTLTRPLIPYAGDLALGISQLREAIGRLSRRKIFRTVVSGVYAIEVVLRPRGFHVHAHLLIDAPWVENRNEHGRPLESVWKKCLVGVGVKFATGEDIDTWTTSDGRKAKRVVVDIRRCDRKTIREVLKYTVKGATARNERNNDPRPPEAGGSSVHTGNKTRISEQISWGEVPPEGLKQLVDVVEGRVHLIEPIKGWRGELAQFRKWQLEEARNRASDKKICMCGGEIIYQSTMPWGDPRLVFLNGEISVLPPPASKSSACS